MGKTYKDNKYRDSSDGWSRKYRHMPQFRDMVKKHVHCGQMNKTGFPTHGEALARANQIMASEQLRGGAVEMRVYQCEFCKNYHLTKKPKNSVYKI